MTSRSWTASIMTLWLGLAGCMGGPQVDMVIEETPRSAVSLERIPDRTFQAAHPVRLSRDLVQRALQGIAVRDRSGIAQTFGSSEAPVIAAFSAEEAALLAPGIAEALARAASDQQVAFRVLQPSSSLTRPRTGAGVGSSESVAAGTSREMTEGSLFLYGRSIYVTLRSFRSRDERPDTVNMPNRRIPDPTGLQQREVVFVPQSVMRADTYAPAFTAAQGLTTLVLDQDRLASASLGPAPSPASPAVAAPAPASPAGMPGQTQAAPGGDLQQIKEDMKKKDTELEELRKELQEIKRQLGGQGTPKR
ncbi:MAG: hypothetical protein KF814_17550 [Nitrospiraceae bacterium]|nr:hypothetical protein [Nitrospiraceae bacterium]